MSGSFDCAVREETIVTSRCRSLSDSEPKYMTGVESGGGGGDFDDQHNWLRELAIIATGPQSPLLPPQSPIKHQYQRSVADLYI